MKVQGEDYTFVTRKLLNLLQEYVLLENMFIYMGNLDAKRDSMQKIMFKCNG